MATFGNTNLEATLSNPLNQIVALGKFQTPADCTSITKITMGIGNTRSGHLACNVKGLIYAADGTGGRPYTRIAVGDAIAVADSFSGWKDLSFGANTVSSSTDYWWGLIGDDNAVGLGFYYTNPGGADYVGSNNYSSPGNPIGGTEYEFSTLKISVYMTYTATGGAQAKHNLTTMKCGTA